MKKMSVVLALVLILAVTFTACSKKGGGSATPPPDGDTPPTVITPATPGTLISSPNPKPVTSFLQAVSNAKCTPGDFCEYFPSHANIWAFDRDFDLDNDQFGYALDMTVGAVDMTVSGTFFPEDQTYDELTFYTPVIGAAEGVKVAEVSNGTRVGYGYTIQYGLLSAFINATSDSRLQQTVSLPTGTTCTLTWEDDVYLEPGNFPGYTPSYSVVLRNGAGAELETLFTTTTNANYGHTKDLSTYAGQSVVLSFEEHSAPSFQYDTFAVVDSVSIKDFSGTNEYVVNGGFENGLTSGWTTNTPVEVQNMTSGPRTLEGLTVTRSFYTKPNQTWGRWVDVFENKTVSEITTTVTYETALGSGGMGIIYPPLAEIQKRALTSWDSSAWTRDIGMVFGNTTTVDYQSASALTSNDGSGTITVTYMITVPANSRAAIVNFIIMNGKYTGLQTAVTSTTRASDIDTEAFNILTKFWSDAQYRNGMTQEQMDAIKNF